jgi:hypothetical protein
MDWLQRRVRELEKHLGMAIVLRPLHSPDPTFRGRISRRGNRVVLEYRDRLPGFFWHYDILRELFSHLEAGCMDLTLTDDSPERAP